MSRHAKSPRKSKGREEHVSSQFSSILVLLLSIGAGGGVGLFFVRKLSAAPSETAAPTPLVPPSTPPSQPPQLLQPARSKQQKATGRSRPRSAAELYKGRWELADLSRIDFNERLDPSMTTVVATGKADQERVELLRQKAFRHLKGGQPHEALPLLLRARAMSDDFASSIGAHTFYHALGGRPTCSNRRTPSRRSTRARVAALVVARSLRVVRQRPSSTSTAARPFRTCRRRSAATRRRRVLSCCCSWQACIVPRTSPRSPSRCCDAPRASRRWATRRCVRPRRRANRARARTRRHDATGVARRR